MKQNFNQNLFPRENDTNFHFTKKRRLLISNDKKINYRISHMHIFFWEKPYDILMLE